MAVDNISVEDWIEEARPMPLLEQALYLYDLLEAKREIKCSPDRNNPERIFDVLKKMFCCSKSRNVLIVLIVLTADIDKPNVLRLPRESHLKQVGSAGLCELPGNVT